MKVTERGWMENHSLNSPPKGGWSLWHIKKICPMPGGTDRVHLSEVIASKEVFVLKRLDKLADEYPSMSSYLIEKEIHLTVNHPNVIRSYGTIETKDALYLMIEYAERGDLLNAAQMGISEVLAANCIKHVAQGLKYLHSMGVVHRDIKAENIVVTQSGLCKIIDFGFAVKVSHNEGVLSDEYCAGTLNYMSPEQLWGVPYDYKIDIWSLGVLSYLLLCGHFPFDPNFIKDFGKKSKTKLLKAISDGNICKSTSFRKLSHRARDFVCRVLTKRSERPTLDELLLHPFLNPSAELASPRARSSSSTSMSSLSSRESSIESGVPYEEPGEKELFFL